MLIFLTADTRAGLITKIQSFYKKLPEMDVVSLNTGFYIDSVPTTVDKVRGDPKSGYVIEKVMTRKDQPVWYADIVVEYFPGLMLDPSEEEKEVEEIKNNAKFRLSEIGFTVDNGIIFG